jgi:glutamyl-Q tRNA(Asp) synthetase
LVGFCDGVFGPTEQHLRDAVGDFVLRRADGLFAYQLAVVVDDAAAGVTQVARGADLLGSTPRQIYLHGCLGQAVPSYIHLPLALAADGMKISKRHGASQATSGRQGGELLRQVLLFLGQPVPDLLAGADARDVLGWGVANFSLARVPHQARLPLDFSPQACPSAAAEMSAGGK